MITFRHFFDCDVEPWHCDIEGVEFYKDGKLVCVIDGMNIADAENMSEDELEEFVKEHYGEGI